jgi:hypothetical protein
MYQFAHRLLDDHACPARRAGAQVPGDGLTIGARELTVDIRSDERIDGRAIRH